MLKSIHLAAHCASVPIVKSLQAPYAVRPAAGTGIPGREAPTAWPSGLTPRTDQGRMAPEGRRTRVPQGPEPGLGTCTACRTPPLAGQIARHFLALTHGDESHSELPRARWAVGGIHAKLDGDQTCCKQWPRAGGGGLQGPPIHHQPDWKQMVRPGYKRLISNREVNIVCASR